MEVKEEIQEIDNLNLKEKIENLPLKPGCYLFKNSADKVIYVGKAIKLRNRVRSYFQNRPDMNGKTRALVCNIVDLEIIITDSEAEALILEDTLIKKLKPRYNISLRDDKTYPFVKITNEEYPRIYATRTVIKDGSKYLGPFADGRTLKYMLKTVNKVYHVRSCKLDITQETIEKKKHKVCLDYQLKKCDGPCEGLVSKELYNDGIKQSASIMSGKINELEKQIEAQMYQASEEMKFETAAMLRNRLILIKDYNAKQKIVTTEAIDREIFGLSRNDDFACVVVLKVREGKLLGKRHYIIHNANEQLDSEIIGRTLESYFIESDVIPKEIFLPTEPEEIEFLTGWLTEKRGNNVIIQIPKQGDKKKLVEMAENNAEQILKEHQVAYEKREQVIPRAVLSLQRDLRLKKPPRVIECFDNSHIQGTDLVSSMVHFEDAKPKKSEYRKFKNKTVLKNDDFATMQEVVERRYSRLIMEIENYNKLENKNETTRVPKLPDLVIIDGGKGQLSAAMEIFDKLGISNKMTIIGLAKRLEEVFFPNESESIILPRSSSSLKLIQHLRDEAHRFAITFHRSLRDKRTLQTELTNIEGVGEKTAAKLLREVGSVKKIKDITEEELQRYVSPKVAKKIIDYFNSKEEDDSLIDIAEEI
jgi:excinuclease ABC subunit C